MAATEPHGYVSTACFHGLHGRCRLVCKFCDVPCRCECHDTPNDHDAYATEAMVEDMANQVVELLEGSFPVAGDVTVSGQTPPGGPVSLTFTCYLGHARTESASG